MAAFQVFMYGRFWVFTEVVGTPVYKTGPGTDQSASTNSRFAVKKPTTTIE